VEEAMVKRVEEEAGVEIEELIVEERMGGKTVKGVKGGVEDEQEERMYTEEVRRQGRRLRRDDVASGWQLDKFDAARKAALDEMDDEDKQREAVVSRVELERDQDQNEEGREWKEEEEETDGEMREMPPLVIPFSPFSAVADVSGRTAMIPAQYPVVMDVFQLQSHALQAASQFHGLHTHISTAAH